MVLQGHELAVEASNACLAQAERLDPRQPRWPYLQAASLLSTNPEAAIEKLERAIELCDCQPDVPRLELGELLLDQGRFPEAAEQFRRISESHPGNARASLGLGRVAYEQRAFALGIAHLDRCVANVHTRQAATLLLAQIYERQGNRSAAERALRQAEDLPKDTAWPDPFQDEVNRLRVDKKSIALRRRRPHSPRPLSGRTQTAPAGA
jgi:tetratricopeptide (TPR) repeat protein